MSANFQLNTGDVLGFNYRNFISKQKGLAISKPDAYYKERNDTMDAVKVICVEETYKALFSLLTKGEYKSGTTAVQISNKPVSYPPQKINDLLIEICSTLADSLEEVVELVFPSDFEKIADSRLLIKTKGESVSV